jgi:hypothetical protein
VAVSRGARFFIASINTAAAAGLAAYTSAFPIAFVRRPELGFHIASSWVAVAAAFGAAVAVALDLALLGWIAVGYLLWLALLAGHALSLVYLALAVSLAPVLPRPDGSLAQGLAIAAITALAVVTLRTVV